MKLLSRRLLWVVLGAAALGAVVIGSWAVMQTMIHSTGDYEFCTNCHSHEPIGRSYREDIHGGNNSAGWHAACADCHIPHDNALHYLWVKGIHGIRDPIMEMLKDPLEIDWHAFREKREHYVYDSGCLECHHFLEKQSQGNTKALLPHRRYFAEPGELKCVQCHQHVGHARLDYHLRSLGWDKKEGESP